MPTVSTSIQNPSSSHPTSRVSFTFERSNPVTEACEIHLLYKLSPSLFVDPYELAQRQASYTFTKWGHTELEKPIHAIQNSDTIVLLTVKLPRLGQDLPEFDVDVPLHTRYLTPLSTGITSGNYRHVPLERPQAFFACPQQPHYRSDIPPPAHISASQLTEAGMPLNSTRFIPLSYSPSKPLDFIRVPVGRTEDLAGVQVTTAAVVLVSFLWLSFSVTRNALRLFGSSYLDHPKSE